MRKPSTSHVGGIQTARHTVELIGQLDAVRMNGATVTTRGSSLRRVSGGSSRVTITRLTRKFAGGITSIDTAARTTTIAADDAVLGTQHATSSETVVSVGGTSASKHYVFAYGTTNPLTIAVSNVTTDTFPVLSEGVWRRALYEVYIDAGAVVVSRIFHVGLIDLTSYYAP